MTFNALVLREHEDRLIAQIERLNESALPDGDVLIDVEYSSLNYKDGMVLAGVGGLVRTYPHIPGVDLSGIVLDSATESFEPGDRVAVTGWRMGEIHWGGYAQRARVPAGWPTKLPDNISTRQAMALGTAGFTAMQALLALEAQGLASSHGSDILVTGASGGLGSCALLLGSVRGHRMVASTGRPENADNLRELGAADVIDRADIAENPQRPLLAERWAGCVDAVGGDTLAHVLAEMAYGSSIAACGLAQSNQLHTTVIPFLLRGVNLLGIDSVMAPQRLRNDVYRALSDALDIEGTFERLELLTSEIPLSEVQDIAPSILEGATRGRVVVNCAR